MLRARDCNFSGFVKIQFFIENVKRCRKESAKYNQRTDALQYVVVLISCNFNQGNHSRAN